MTVKNNFQTFDFRSSIEKHTIIVIGEGKSNSTYDIHGFWNRMAGENGLIVDASHLSCIKIDDGAKTAQVIEFPIKEDYVVDLSNVGPKMLDPNGNLQLTINTVWDWQFNVDTTYEIHTYKTPSCSEDQMANTWSYKVPKNTPVVKTLVEAFENEFKNKYTAIMTHIAPMNDNMYKVCLGLWVSQYDTS
jgi:hypothetical protein